MNPDSRKGTPPAAIEALSAAYAKAIAVPGIREKLNESGISAEPSSPKAYGAFIKEESASSAELITRLNIKLE